MFNFASESLSGNRGRPCHCSLGIWSMHSIGMLAYSLPVTIFCHWPTVLLSLLAAILASAVALFVVSRNEMGHCALAWADCSWDSVSQPCTMPFHDQRNLLPSG